MHPRFVIALAGLGALDLGYIDFILGPRVLVAKPSAVSHRTPAAASNVRLEAAPSRAPTLTSPAPAAAQEARQSATPVRDADDRRGPPGGTWWIVNFPAAGQVTLSEAAEQQLAQVAARFARSHDIRINIVGHADERGQDELNERLGALRAQAVSRALQRAGFDASQVAIISRGEGAPAVLGSDPGAWAANRRAEIQIVTVAKSKPMGESTQ